MKVIALTSRCIGSGACVLACSQVFTQRESDGVVELLQERPALELLPKVQRAVAACPAGVFVVEEEDDLSELTLATNDEDL
ncbi:MAG TPA: ferredoxin [Roseiflexaceae bacterium]|nr:ferredoxin [Roseiflexaceae bacterium]